jgi:hypothetical protein
MANLAAGAARYATGLSCARVTLHTHPPPFSDLYLSAAAEFDESRGRQEKAADSENFRRRTKAGEGEGVGRMQISLLSGGGRALLLLFLAARGDVGQRL